MVIVESKLYFTKLFNLTPGFRVLAFTQQIPIFLGDELNLMSDQGAHILISARAPLWFLVKNQLVTKRLYIVHISSLDAGYFDNLPS